MKPHMVRKFAFLILVILLMADSAAAQDGGLGADYDLNQSTRNQDSSGSNGACGMANNCHDNKQAGATISISSNPAGPYKTGQTNIQINVTTLVPTYANMGTILGIMVVNSSFPGDNIKNIGWVITKDANNNIVTPKNYNEKTGLGTLNHTYLWNLTSMNTEGIYYIYADARYGKISSPKVYYNITSLALTMEVDAYPPSVISNTGGIYVKNMTFLTLNASITDSRSGVKNATVNVSSVNSTINEANLTLSGSYWLNTTIIADRGDTGGFMNLTITSYDNAGYVNNTINITVGIDDNVPSVISNTNNVSIANGSIIPLNATITDALSDVKNATVNVSAINSTLNEVILTLQGGFWLNTTVIANKGNGLVNLTITAYDNAGNVNKSINMTARITPPSITSRSNNFTNNDTLLFDLPVSTSVNFNITANQSVTYQWIYNDIDQGQNFNNFSNFFSTLGSHYINVSVSNVNGTDYKNWTVNVVPVTIDVTLSNVPVEFGSLFAGTKNQSSVLPLNVTIQSTTNVNVNLTLNGTEFIFGINNFGVGNMTYSNSSTGTKTFMTGSFPLPPYINWANISRLVTGNRSIYLWLTIPDGQESGDYTSEVNVRVERYI